MLKPYTRSGTMCTDEVTPRCVNSRGRGRHRWDGADMAQRTCSIDECERPRHARGWCRLHYRRWADHGDPLYVRRVTSCPQGHPYPENRTFSKGRAKGCKACNRDAQRERNRRAGVPPARRVWAVGDERRIDACPQGHPYPESLRYVRGKSKGCGVCHREAQRARYRADPETHRRKASEWQRRNRQAATERYRKWCQDNIEHHRAYNRMQARWRAVGKDDEAFEYSEILRGDPCSYCPSKQAGTVDHIVPVTADGGNEWANLTAACASCNATKRTRSLLEFMLACLTVPA